MPGLKEVHLQATNRVLQYLKELHRKGILFKRSTWLILEAYKDADYDVSISMVHRRFTTGYCTFFGGNLVK